MTNVCKSGSQLNQIGINNASSIIFTSWYCVAPSGMGDSRLSLVYPKTIKHIILLFQISATILRKLVYKAKAGGLRSALYTLQCRTGETQSRKCLIIFLKSPVGVAQVLQFNTLKYIIYIMYSRNFVSSHVYYFCSDYFQQLFFSIFSVSYRSPNSNAISKYNCNIVRPTQIKDAIESLDKVSTSMLAFAVQKWSKICYNVQRYQFPAHEIKSEVYQS